MSLIPFYEICKKCSYVPRKLNPSVHLNREFYKNISLVSGDYTGKLDTMMIPSCSGSK